MGKKDTKLDNVHLEASNALGELARLFVPEMKLTFVARHPTSAECHVVVTNDDLTELAKLIAKKAVTEEAQQPTE